MNENTQYTVVDGIKCFSPEVASSYDDYPEGGFDLTDRFGGSGRAVFGFALEIGCSKALSMINWLQRVKRNSLK